MFRVGLISDTHGLLREGALRRLRSCDHIVHGGDIGGPAILERLAGLAPLTVVRGTAALPSAGGACRTPDRRAGRGGAYRRAFRRGSALTACNHASASRFHFAPNRPV
jgi:hypothetical protein